MVRARAVDRRRLNRRRVYMLLIAVLAGLCGLPARVGQAGALPSGPNVQLTDAGLIDLAQAEAPDLAALGSTVYAVWADDRNYAPNAFAVASVLFARSNDGGQSWGPNLRLSDPAFEGGVESPQIAVAADGTLWVAWYLRRCEAGFDGRFCGGVDRRNDIRIARSADGGQSWQETTAFDGDDDLADADGLALAVDQANGNLYLLTRRAAGDGYDIVLLIVDVARGQLRGPLKLSDGTGNGRLAANRGPRLSLAVQNGLVCAAWEDARGPQAIFGVCSNDGGQQFGANLAISAPDSRFPRLALSPDQSVYAAYQRGERGDIVLRRSSDQGATWGAERIVAAPGDGQDVLDFDLAVDAAGQQVLLYPLRNSLERSSDLLLATAIDQGGFATVSVEDGQGRFPGTAVQSQVSLAIGGGADGVVAMAWQDNRNVQRQIWGARATLDGTPPSVPGNLQATPGDTSIVLSWQASSDASGIRGYLVQRATAGGAFTTITPFPVAALGYRDVGLDTASYSYRVIAVDGTGNLGPPSAVTTAAARVGTGLAGLRGSIAYRVGSEIRLRPLPGLQPQRLLTQGNHPRFASDGQRVYYYDSAEAAIYSLAVGGDDRRLEHQSANLTEWYDLAADANQLATINTIRYFGPTLPAGFCDAFAPSYRTRTPEQVVFSANTIVASEVALAADQPWLSYRVSGFCNNGAIGQRSPADFCLVNLTNSAISCQPGEYRDADFAPRGGDLVFAADFSGQREIWKARVTTDGQLSGLTQLTRGAAGMPASEPAWSSDGNWIIFQRDTDPGAAERAELYVVRADGDGLRALKLEGTAPAWQGGGPAPAAPPSLPLRLGLPLLLS